TLSRLGSPLSVDGIVGERTRAAIRDFQREHDLRPSGTPDPLTAQRLQAAATGRAAPWVAVVRPTQSVETAAYRGARQSGVPVDWHYELAGFRVMVLEG